MLVASHTDHRSLPGVAHAGSTRWVPVSGHREHRPVQMVLVHTSLQSIPQIERANVAAQRPSSQRIAVSTEVQRRYRTAFSGENLVREFRNNVTGAQVVNQHVAGLRCAHYY